MKKVNKHIVIVCTDEPGLSSMSDISRQALLKTLKKHYSRVSIFIVNNVKDLNLLIKIRPDLVFLGMKFIPKNYEKSFNDMNKNWISTFLDENGITYTGSNQRSHELELNKHLAKAKAIEHHINTSPFYYASMKKKHNYKKLSLKFPLFIKPANRGGGLGIDDNSIVYSHEEIKQKVDSIKINYQSSALIEEFLPGREFSVAILKDLNTKKYNAMPIELAAPQDKMGNRVLSVDVKKSNTELVMAVANNKLNDDICNLALNAFAALGARDYGRIDIRLDSNNVPHFLEANLLPSLISGYGSFPKSCLLNENLNYEQMILGITNLAFSRQTSLDIDVKQPLSLQKVVSLAI